MMCSFSVPPEEQERRKRTLIKGRRSFAKFARIWRGPKKADKVIKKIFPAIVKDLKRQRELPFSLIDVDSSDSRFRN